MFRPPVPANLLGDFENYDEDVFDYLHSLTLKIPQVKYTEFTSVVVRLKDTRYSVLFWRRKVMRNSGKIYRLFTEKRMNIRGSTKCICRS